MGVNNLLSLMKLQKEIAIDLEVSNITGRGLEI